jgi:hypothetical protein
MLFELLCDSGVSNLRKEVRIHRLINVLLGKWCIVSRILGSRSKEKEVCIRFEFHCFGYARSNREGHRKSVRPF